MPIRSERVSERRVGIDNDGPPKLENFGEVSPRLFYKVGGRIWVQRFIRRDGYPLYYLSCMVFYCMVFYA